MVEWSEQQRAVFDWVRDGRGSVVVEAVAGAGKTTTLVEAVRRMGGRVFLGAYNKKMADELKTRVADLTSVTAGTFHSAGFGALRRFLGRVEVDDKKVRRIVDAQLRGTKEEGWESAVCALTSMAKQSGFRTCVVPTPAMSDWLGLVTRYEIDEKLPDDADVRVLVRHARTALDASSRQTDVVDFDDMVWLPLHLNLRMFQNDWVLVDEAQDTSPTRLALAEKMLRHGGRLMAVGDPHQAIFGFTGADSDSLDNIRRKFGAATLRLSVTYRCPKAVVAVAHEYVNHIQAADTAPRGEHLEVEYDEMLALAGPGDAVLCRYNAPLVDLCFKFIRAGKAAKIEGRAIGEGLAVLAGRWKVRSIDQLDAKLEKYLNRERDKLAGEDNEAKLERVEDHVSTMRCLMDRGRETGLSTVAALQEMIRSMFDDVGASPRLIVLSSVHRSKGLEWPRVFVLGRRELMPSRRAKQPWMVEQENNLCYVCVTRAKHTLVDVAMPVAEAKPTQKTVAQAA